MLAITHSELLPSVIHTTSAFTPGLPEAILRPPCARFRGSVTQPAALLNPASDSRCRACPRISLLTCWLSFGQVGLSRYAITHWVTVSNFMKLTPIPTIWVYLGASRFRALIESLDFHSINCTFHLPILKSLAWILNPFKN